jgi:two-component system, OmpR family, sensor kinase
MGVLLAAFLNGSDAANPLFQLLFSLSTALLILGLLTTAALLAGRLIWLHGDRRYREMSHQQQDTLAADRRRFLRRLDHELKNPLMAMRAGLANFANAPNDATRRAALNTVEAQTVRLSRLTSDLRKIAELGTARLERTSINLEPLLEEVLDLVREKPATGQRRLSLLVPRAPWPLPSISGDWDLIFLAIYNLLDNSVKFSQPGDTIEVRGREEGRHVILEVADTGPGINESELPHVWEELYRGEGGRNVAGSGLGLALVKAVVEAHGGSVALSSKKGQGTVVTLRLPSDSPER